jgi:hypothetical protein
MKARHAIVSGALVLAFGAVTGCARVGGHDTASGEEPSTFAAQSMSGTTLTDRQAKEEVQAECHGTYRNHGQCQKCVAHEAALLARRREITAAQHAEIVSLFAEDVCSTKCIPAPELHATTCFPVCGTAPETSPKSSVDLQCPDGLAIVAVDFASYGTPTGTCGDFQLGDCNAADSVEVVERLCRGKTSCTVDATNPTFGDPCVGTTKRLFIQVSCG